MPTHHHIIIGDSREMSAVPDGGAHLAVTSPPYWQLKDYGAQGQIGYNDTFETYINHLNLVWQECHRALAPGCRLCINIGDQFARAATYGRYKVIPIHAHIIAFCEAIGFDYLGAIIWQKKASMHTTGGASLMGSYPHPRNGLVTFDYEYILLFKKLGQAPKPAPQAKAASRLSKEEWQQYFAGHWTFAGAKQDSHIAVFPPELPRRLIKMFSFVGDTVLDPFAGSGSTALAAKDLSRNSFGYEINPDFLPLIQQKLTIAQADLAGSRYTFSRQPAPSAAALARRLAALPHRFADPHHLDKKTDPKQQKTGAKISAAAPAAPEQYFTVREILSPTHVRLSNNDTIRLLGIAELPAARAAAMEFLRAKTRTRKVYLRHSDTQPRRDQNNHLLAYLYLQNKTFLNAHLLKNALAKPDNTIPHKHQARFAQLADLSNSRQ